MEPNDTNKDQRIAELEAKIVRLEKKIEDLEEIIHAFELD